jgi:hypothetical protein
MFKLKNNKLWRVKFFLNGEDRFVHKCYKKLNKNKYLYVVPRKTEFKLF